jgi:hypothetical protein
MRCQMIMLHHPWNLTTQQPSCADFWAYYGQLKTSLGLTSVNSICYLYCLMRCQIIMLHHSWNRTTQHPSCGDCTHWRFSRRLFLSQLLGPSQQPASAAASRRVLEPDILEVSHLCGCMYWERVCVHNCVWLLSNAYDRQVKNRTTF